MITRPHVCLRCQLRLARCAPSRVQALFQSTSTNGVNTPKQRPGDNVNQDDTQRYRRPRFLHQTEFSQRPQSTQHSMGRARSLRGQHKQREVRENLGMDALGRPADVIVLKASKFRTYSHFDLIDSDAQPQSIDILAALDSERGLAGQQEVDENIDQFRPKDGAGPRDWDAFNSLVKDIQASFTVSQLARYIKSFDKHHEEETWTSNSWFLIPRVSPWMPKSSQTTQGSDDNYTQGYSLASYTNKQRMVLRLLRECWKVEVPEVEAKVGEVELELKPKDYDLLLRGSRSVLSLIAAEYITGENEKIDGFGSEHTIRVTTTRRKSEMVINEVEQALRNIRRENIYLGDLMQPGHNKHQLRKWVDTQFNNSVIKDLSRLTNTDIEVLPKERLIISCVDQMPGSVKGNKIDIAIRLLLTSANFSNRVTDWLGCREASKSSSGVFIRYTAVDGLGWRDRLRLWTRWTAPTVKRIEDEDGPESDSILEPPVNDTLSPKKKKSDSVLEPPANDALSPSKIESADSATVSKEMTDAVEQKHDSQPADMSATLDKPKISAHWQDSYRLESSALIGSILHNYENDAKASTMAVQPIGKAVKVHRAFSTAVPNLSKLLGSESTRGIRPKPLRTLIMHFQPNPFFKSRKTSKPVGAAALSVFPPVEMRFSTDQETGAFKVRDIQAIVSIGNSDLMLPESASDVRFQQRSVSTLVASPNQYPHGIVEFLRNSSLDIKEGNFDAPAKLTIPIATHLCQAPGFAIMGEGEEGADTQDVEYLFTGLEIRKTVMMSYEGWRLHYTSIEAGRAGGRRGELRLLPVRLDKSSSPATEEEFLETACKLAAGVMRGTTEEDISRKVHVAKPITKIWVDPKPNPSEQIPRYFSKRVDIRQPNAKMQESGEHSSEGEEIEFEFA